MTTWGIGMIQRTLLTALALILASCVTTQAEGEPARTFISEMLTGVGATTLDCPIDVRDRIASREMQVVCARFDGDFTTFESRWTLHILQDAIYDKNYGGGVIPTFEARTGWEASGETHDRIYAVGDSTLGVRFTAGEILMVYK